MEDTFSSNYGAGKVYATNLFLAPAGRSKIRFIHCKLGLDFNILLDGQLFLSPNGGFRYQSYTFYDEVNSGPHTLQLLDLNNVQIKKFGFELIQNQDYTFIVHGPKRITNRKVVESVDVMMLQDDNKCPTKGKLKIRVIHPAAELPSVDFIVGNQEVKDLSYKGSSLPLYFEENAGLKNILVKKDKNVLSGPIPINFRSNAIYTYCLSGSLSPEFPINIIEIEDSQGLCN